MIKTELFTISKDKTILCKSVDLNAVISFLNLLGKDEEITIWKEGNLKELSQNEK